jgi:hypothetical protein
VRWQVLARIPEAGPWTAFVTVHPSVAHEVEEGELRQHFHDGEKIKVERVRIVLHRDSGNVKMAFVDFDDAASLRNALFLQVLSLGAPELSLCFLLGPARFLPQYRTNVGFHPAASACARATAILTSFALCACATGAVPRSPAQGRHCRAQEE